MAPPRMIVTCEEDHASRDEPPRYHRFPTAFRVMRNQRIYLKDPVLCIRQDASSSRGDGPAVLRVALDPPDMLKPLQLRGSS